MGSSLVPAWKSTRTDLVGSSQESDEQTIRGDRDCGAATFCVCGQVALSLVLLTVAVFLFRAYQSEYGRGPGFRTDHVLLMSFEPDLAGYDAARADRFYDQLSDRARRIPGVTVRGTHVIGAIRRHQHREHGRRARRISAPPGTESVRVRSARVDEGYFDTLGIRHRRWPNVSSDRYAGRASRRRRQRNVCVALLAGPGRRRQALPVDRRRWHHDMDRNRRHRQRTRAIADISEGPTEFIYYSRRQISAPDATIMLHTDGDPQAFASPLRAAVRAIDPNMPVFGVRTMEDFYRASSVAVTEPARRDRRRNGLNGTGALDRRICTDSSRIP